MSTDGTNELPPHCLSEPLQVSSASLIISPKLHSCWLKHTKVSPVPSSFSFNSQPNFCHSQRRFTRPSISTHAIWCHNFTATATATASPLPSSALLNTFAVQVRQPSHLLHLPCTLATTFHTSFVPFRYFKPNPRHTNNFIHTSQFSLSLSVRAFVNSGTNIRSESFVSSWVTESFLIYNRTDGVRWLDWGR